MKTQFKIRILRVQAWDSSDSEVAENNFWEVIEENPELLIWPGREEAIKEADLISCFGEDINSSKNGLSNNQIAGNLLLHRVEPKLTYDSEWFTPDEHRTFAVDVWLEGVN